MELHTHQMESDTATEEREVNLQRAEQALKSGDQTMIRTVRDQLREHYEMYQADPAIEFVAATLRKLDAALGEASPDAYAYPGDDGG